MENKRKIYFRADAGAQIGYGHFIRTLALADMLKDDFDCTFFTQSPTEYQQREVEKVCPLIALPSDESKFEKFLEYLSGDEIVVLDNYFFTSEYQKQIKDQGCKLVCIDDMHDKHYYADVVINHGLTDESLFDVEPYTKLCLGIEWMLLRKPFLYSQRKPNSGGKPFSQVAVCFGGADPFNLTYCTINQLLKYKFISSIDVIGGDKSESIEDKRVHFYRGLGANAVRDIFEKCDVAIVSLSTVCLEALMCGAYVLAGWYVDNQKEGYQSLVSQGVIQGLGNIEKGIPDLSRYFSHSISLPIYKPCHIPERYVSLFKSF